VLQPEGSVEVIEEGPVLSLHMVSTPLTCGQILFSPYFQGGLPSLSGRITRPMPPAQSQVNRFSIALPSSTLTPVEKALHEHIILDFLFNSVFESRFINTKPTGLFQSLRLDVAR